ncbi:MAG: hypothetical protein UT24_C0008G0102 [Candidatus Woesebacteria bacterium GW2011_GWB1_39_12]|uniref:Uncharacterized protein n=1 Tax=Candidatus Woesebacteria bacterium GW2011_GWB1_39_12 TaxID=1618574 RepID=A0A0G0MA27_9BACT|nr:MAG: hypothetical protein UT24_C0008G0102 [Candidatus Woesebacteria bacterium GW2011_GWB1_39_12]
MKLNLPKNKLRFPKFRFDKHIPIILILLVVIGLGFYFFNTKTTSLQNLITSITSEKDKNLEELQKIAKELEDLKNQDQLKRNDELQKEIQNIEKTYDKAVSIYESLLDLKDNTNKTSELDELFSKSLSYLADRDYSSASTTLDTLATKIKEEEVKVASTFKIPENVPVQNAPPGSGYSRQQVQTEAGTFLVNIIAADLRSKPKPEPFW